MKRDLKWIHVWDDGVVHVSIQRGKRCRIYTAPSRGLVMWLSEIALNLVTKKHGAFAPSTVGLGWSWKP